MSKEIFLKCPECGGRLIYAPDVTGLAVSLDKDYMVVKRKSEEKGEYYVKVPLLPVPYVVCENCGLELREDDLVFLLPEPKPPLGKARLKIYTRKGVVLKSLGTLGSVGLGKQKALTEAKYALHGFLKQLQLEISSEDLDELLRDTWQIWRVFQREQEMKFFRRRSATAYGLSAFFIFTQLAFLRKPAIYRQIWEKEPVIQRKDRGKIEWLTFVNQEATRVF